MSTIDIHYLRTWIGNSRADEDIISARTAGLLAATVDFIAADTIRDGEYLPPLWHWIYFLEGVPSSELGRDGHPLRGGFLPQVPLSNRMWAGGRLSFLAPVCIGSTVRKESKVLDVTYKRGRSGDLVFVTVLHELWSQQGDLLIQEEQDIVYKNATPSSAPSVVPTAAPDAQFSKIYIPDSTMLFRYSALTFNGHRIHYDLDYCREEEGYQNLVIHGPLNATMLAGYAEVVSGKRVRKFSYRGVSPALLGDSITLRANVRESEVSLYATLGNSTVCMQAEAIVG